MDTVKFMERLLEDAVDDDYYENVKAVIQELKNYRELSDIAYAQYSSIDDLEKALREFAGVD